MQRKICVLTLAVAAFALPGLAQSSKLNGTWKLNSSKSNFGTFPPPTSETDTITISGDEFKQEYTSVTARGEQKGMRSCTVDGKEVNLTPDDPRVQLGAVKLSKMQCSREGNAVVFLETANLNGSTLTDKLTFSPADDGNTMTMDSHITSATINGDRKLVYDKADASNMMATPAASMAASGGGSGAHPNLSGTWKLNIPKSNFGQIPGPAGQTDTIDDSEPSVKIAEDQKGGMMGDMALTTTLSTDGTPTTSAGMGGAAVASTSHWDGGSLVVNSKTKFQDADITIKDTYTLSADGKTLTEVTHIESGMGNFDTTSVYDKQ